MDPDKLRAVPALLANKHYAAPSVFQPESLLREARRQKNLPQAEVPAVCILDPDGDIVRHLQRSGRARRSKAWACYHTDLFEFENEGIAFGIIGCAVGASFAVLLAEQLFVSGCRLVVSVTSAGQIVPRGEPPYYVAIERALRDEGTSYHYLPPSEFSDADPVLVAAAMGELANTGLTVHRGASWTTDAPFRETERAIEACRAHDILAVEMEAAALYAFARARAKPVLCFAHVTNQMAVSEGDFEKGAAGGAHDSLSVIAATARSWLAAQDAERKAEPIGDASQIAAAREVLFRRLSELGIETRTVDYPAHRTVAEGQALRGNMAGCFTKNLLLRDKKGRLFLVVAQEDQFVDLKTLHGKIGANGRLGFASTELMHEVLGVEPGALTPLALVNDRMHRVTPVFERRLIDEGQLNFHPLVNTESLGISPKDLLAFIASCGHSAVVVELATMADAPLPPGDR